MCCPHSLSTNEYSVDRSREQEPRGCTAVKSCQNIGESDQAEATPKGNSSRDIFGMENQQMISGNPLVCGCTFCFTTLRIASSSTLTKHTDRQSGLSGGSETRYLLCNQLQDIAIAWHSSCYKYRRAQHWSHCTAVPRQAVATS